MQERETEEHKLEENKTAHVSWNIPVITLHLHGLNTPIKRQRLAE